MLILLGLESFGTKMYTIYFNMTMYCMLYGNNELQKKPIPIRDFHEKENCFQCTGETYRKTLFIFIRESDVQYSTRAENKIRRG